MFGFPWIEVTPRMARVRHSVAGPAVSWRRPLLAVAAGTVLGLPAAAQTATAQQAPLLPAEVIVRAAGFWQSGGECGGTTNPVYIRAEPNPRDNIQVGFFESSAEAIGAMYKASGWLAALVSTELLEFDLSRYRISFSSIDRIDGPSAGGLMTSGMIALLRGDRVPADVGMTGTINPDGTIGPVGGIPLKIQGAADSGFKRFGIPLGQRRNRNPCTGEIEDVIEAGRALGIEVAEVGDIREAYTFLTGIDLPVPPSRPVSTAVPDDLREEYRSLYQNWTQRYQNARGTVARAEKVDFPSELQTFWTLAEKFRTSGERELQGGHEPAAFNRIWMAVLNAEFAARAVTAAQAVRTRGFDGLHGVVGQEITLVEQDLDNAIDQLKGIELSSVTDAGAIASIGSQLAVGLAFLEQARESLAQSRSLTRARGAPDVEQIVKRSFEALAQISVAGPMFDMAVAGKGWLGRGGPAWRENADTINSARVLYQSAARSNLRYVDTVHTMDFAEKQVMDLASAQAWMKRSDPSYLATAGAIQQQFGFFDLFEDDYVAAFAQLGALMGAVADASLLVAKYYSLQAELDEQGLVVGFYRQAALEKMMKWADKTTVTAIGEADLATGGGATPMLMVALDAARRNRDESVAAQDKLTALSLFWHTTLNARMMTRLARDR